MMTTTSELTDMTEITLSLGSNHEAAKQMTEARTLLREVFADIVFSSDLQTEPVGIRSAPFLNCMAWATTDLCEADVKARLKEIEARCGNRASLRRRNIVVMDIDLLAYGSKKLKPADWQREYVLRLTLNNK